MKFLIVLLLGVSTASAYIRFAPSGGAPLVRSDFANVQFHVNDAAVPGLLNAAGQPFITADSDPLAALKAAAASWNVIPTSAARFAPLDTVPAVNDSTDGMNVIVFRDTPEIRSALGSALAMNLYSIFPGGQIAETDILFNPTKTFSTTQAAGTYDIQSIATHEFGHALGANHSGILSAVMFHLTLPGQISQRTLSPDDVLFASTVYPAPGATPFGTISGRLTGSDGSPFRGGLITAINTATGDAIGSFSSLLDGTYSFQTPPGDYYVSAEPLGGALQPGNLYLTPAQVVDTAVQPGFLGGNDSPAILSVSAGDTANGDIAVTAGASNISIQLTAVGAAGGSGDALLFQSGPRTLASGKPADLLFVGMGIDKSLMDANIRLLGPGVALRPGSVRIDPAILVGGLPVVRITLDVDDRLTAASATLVVSKDGSAAVFSGGLILNPSN